MKSEEFRIWIRGYLQLSSEVSLTAKQIRIISNHAKLVKVLGKTDDINIVNFVSALHELLELNEIVSREELLREVVSKLFYEEGASATTPVNF